MTVDNLETAASIDVRLGGVTVSMTIQSSGHKQGVRMLRILRSKFGRADSASLGLSLAQLANGAR